MANHRDIAEIVAVISAAYPNFTPTEHTVEVYLQTLKDIPADELKAATLHCVAEAGRKFAPSVGEIRGAIGEIRRAVANVPDSYAAWQEVQQQILENGGDYGTPVWSNPLVEQAVRRLGWRNLRMSEEQTADRARFVQCYDQLLERATKEDMLLPEVRGFIEAGGGRLLRAPAEQIKMLADRMGGKK